LAVTAHRYKGHAQGVFDPLHEGGEVGVSSRPPALGQQDFARETVADHPEACMAPVGLEAIEGQDDPAVGRGKAPQATGIWEREAEQVIIALQEVGDGAWGHGHPTVAHGMMDCGATAVVGIALAPHEGHDIEAELGLGQGEAAFGFRPIGCARLRAVGVRQRRICRVSCRTASRVVRVR
jgi:hypothetical protein